MSTFLNSIIVETKRPLNGNMAQRRRRPTRMSEAKADFIASYGYAPCWIIALFSS